MNPNPPIASPFEALQRGVFDTVKSVMGFTASWTPSAGGDAIEKLVLFQNPTEEMKLAGVEYDPTAWRMEYRFEDFPGLEDAVNARASNEVVVIEGTEYYIAKVSKKFDGKTFIAELQPK